MIGIQFKPGGAFPFFRFPASEAEDTSIALEHLWPGRANEIREQLLSAASIGLMFSRLEQFLLGQLVRPLELHPAVRYAMNQFQQPCAISAVVAQIGLSSRRFIELFRQQIGLAPKAFCRVRRFQRVLQTMHLSKEIDGAALALECGYYDQAHFIHDFQSFSGFSPSAYLARATEHLNHVPLP